MGTTIIDRILAVWLAVFGWVPDAIESLTPIFYVPETGLTFVGYLSVGGMAVAATLLFLNLIQNWMRFGR